MLRYGGKLTKFHLSGSLSILVDLELGLLKFSFSLCWSLIHTPPFFPFFFPLSIEYRKASLGGRHHVGPLIGIYDFS
jgi:hypothetical protein